MVKAGGLSPHAHLPEIIDAWLFALGATKPSPRTLAAYRADVEGVARRVDTDGAAVLHLEHLTKAGPARRLRLLGRRPRRRLGSAGPLGLVVAVRLPGDRGPGRRPSRDQSVSLGFPCVSTMETQGLSFRRAAVCR
jgi:hypothetical protein